MNIHFPIPLRTQHETETSLYQLFEDISALTKDAKNPISKARLQNDVNDLFEARDNIDWIIRELMNG